MILPDCFLRRPIAHRAYHNNQDGRPENSRAAIKAAMAMGYPVEIDLQLSCDGQAMVFHDYDLQRLTGAMGAVRQRTLSEMQGIPLLGGDETVPTLKDVLTLVAGQVPVLIELKDQDGGLGSNTGVLEAATAAALQGYAGEVALMSFNPHMVAELARLLPERPRGLTTCSFCKSDWIGISEQRLTELRGIPDFDRVGASFVSHDAGRLADEPVSALKARGIPILCWTTQTPEDEAQARRFADNVTFEGYAA